jgi:DNA-binding transcriptional regulator YiaG
LNRGKKMKYKSEILEVLHENAVEMYKIGGITDASMREYDEMCLANPKTENKSSSAYANKNSVNIEHISHATA